MGHDLYEVGRVVQSYPTAVTLIWQNNRTCDIKLSLCSRRFAQAVTSDRLTSADPDLHCAWNYAVLAGFVNNAQISISKRKRHCFLLTAIEMHAPKPL